MAGAWQLFGHRNDEAIDLLDCAAAEIRSPSGKRSSAKKEMAKSQIRRHLCALFMPPAHYLILGC